MQDGSTILDNRYIFRALSIVSIDSDAQVYEFIGTNFKFSSGAIPPVKTNVYLSGSILMIHSVNNLSTHEINLFKLDTSFSSISLQKSVTIKLRECWFHIIDDNIVCARIGLINPSLPSNVSIATNFMWINDDNTFVEIENSGACFKSHFLSGSTHKVTLI
jgi:hypothetical protein